MAVSLPARLNVSLLGAACFMGTAVPTVARAQSLQAQAAPVASSDTRRLTDADRQAILESNTIASAAAARGELPGADFVDRRIHGEVGVMLGSNGSRAVYGTADIPLGDRAEATVSFESSRFAYRR